MCSEHGFPSSCILNTNRLLHTRESCISDVDYPDRPGRQRVCTRSSAHLTYRFELAVCDVGSVVISWPQPRMSWPTLSLFKLGSRANEGQGPDADHFIRLPHQTFFDFEEEKNYLATSQSMPGIDDGESRKAQERSLE